MNSFVRFNFKLLSHAVAIYLATLDTSYSHQDELGAANLQMVPQFPYSRPGGVWVPVFVFYLSQIVN